MNKYKDLFFYKIKSFIYDFNLFPNRLKMPVKYQFVLNDKLVIQYLVAIEYNI